MHMYVYSISLSLSIYIYIHTISLVSSMFPRIVTSPVDVHWSRPMVCQRPFPMEFNFCDVWCAIVCPE